MSDREDRARCTAGSRRPSLGVERVLAKERFTVSLFLLHRHRCPCRVERGPPPCIVHGESPRPRFAASSRRLAASVRCSPEKRVDNDFSRGVAGIKENFHSSPCQPASPEFVSPFSLSCAPFSFSLSLSLSLSLVRLKGATRRDYCLTPPEVTRIKRILFRTGTRALPRAIRRFDGSERFANARVPYETLFAPSRLPFRRELAAR